MLQKRWWQVLVVDGNRNAKFRTCAVKQARMTSSLVMDIEASAFERRDDTLRFQRG
jgi:hypothetical protein